MDEQAGSITFAVVRLREGDGEAAALLWERFSERLLNLARLRLAPRLRRSIGEEDIVVCAFEKLRRAVVEGKLPSVRDRDHLWCLLARNIRHKITSHARAELGPRRGGGNVVGESDMARAPADSQEGHALEQVPGPDPLPEFVAMRNDELARLDDEEQRRTALLWMEGYDRAEIGAQLECSVAKVDRLLRRIRTIWLEDLHE